MTTAQPSPVVAIVNSDDVLIRILRLMLETRGLATIATDAERTEDIAAAAAQVRAFLLRADPQVVLFDIPYPYERHWTLFQQVRRADDLRDRPFVLTTTHPRLVRSWTAPEDAAAIIEVPFGVEDLLQAVRRALGTARDGSCA